MFTSCRNLSIASIITYGIMLMLVVPIALALTAVAMFSCGYTRNGCIMICTRSSLKYVADKLSFTIVVYSTNNLITWQPKLALQIIIHMWSWSLLEVNQLNTFCVLSHVQHIILLDLLRNREQEQKQNNCISWQMADDYSIFHKSCCTSITFITWLSFTYQFFTSCCIPNGSVHVVTMHTTAVLARFHIYTIMGWNNNYLWEMFMVKSFVLAGYSTNDKFLIS